MQFHQFQLPNGLDVVAESNPQAQSVGIGFFVRTGSRDETPEVAGVSHFLEHMAFKGDETYSAADINRVFDEVGANYNASTSEEITFFYAAILPEYLDQTFALLATLLRPSLRTDDFEMEKQVILEEIGMYDDMPAFAVYEHAMALHFRDHPLGKSILGTNDSITALTSEQMRAYHAERYRAGNIVLAAAGNIDPDHLRSLAEQHCSEWTSGGEARNTTEARPAREAQWLVKPSLRQEHVMEMAPAPPARDRGRFAAEMIATILGDDGAGRLYWELVETGEAESADLSYNDYDGAGTWATYLCCDPEKTEANRQRIAQVLDEFMVTGPTVDEIEQARNKVATRTVLQSERPMGRLALVGGNWLYRHEYLTVKDELHAVQSTTADDIRDVLDRYPLTQSTCLGLGPIES
ncbi:Uncharacterized zinc protease ML0855 [Durusdinium trenchii]|uniref:Uncharacterized zinc protease ML0855 n=1 Tax=Durusdinium trenchii TaxID=1381693 RepID=A0ABP0JDF4_9DINO